VAFQFPAKKLQTA